MALVARNLHSSMRVVEKFGAQKREAKLPFLRLYRKCDAAIMPLHAPSPPCPCSRAFLRASGRDGTCEADPWWGKCSRWVRSMSHGCDACEYASCSDVFWDVPWCVSCLILLKLPSVGRCHRHDCPLLACRLATRSCPSHNRLRFHE